MTGLDFLDHLARESARFAEALQEAPPDAPVPSCPDWNADDLLWHLANVQWFWASVVRQKIVDSSSADALEASRPEGRTSLEAFFHQASDGLRRVLTENPPETPAWTWSTEQTVGFIRRRQAHEALIHRVDAELTTGVRTEMDPALCADGVDEALRIMYGFAPPWGSFVPDEECTVRLSTTDTNDSWDVVLGQFTGTDPEDGKTYDEPDIRVLPSGPANGTAASLEASASDLDCWLWHRPPNGAVERAGNDVVLTAFETIIAPGVN